MTNPIFETYLFISARNTVCGNRQLPTYTLANVYLLQMSDLKLLSFPFLSLPIFNHIKFIIVEKYKYIERRYVIKEKRF